MKGFISRVFKKDRYFFISLSRHGQNISGSMDLTVTTTRGRYINRRDLISQIEICAGREIEKELSINSIVELSKSDFLDYKSSESVSE